MSEALTYEYQEQHELLQRLLQPQPAVAAIEGGPCGGKSTLLAEIQQQAAETGRPIVVIPEAIDGYHKELRKSGTSIPELAEHNRPAFLYIQAMVLKDVISAIEEKRREHHGTNAIIVVDRADIGAYVTDIEHKAILEGLGKQAPPIYEYVDQVYYLPSVAREDPEKYDLLKGTNPGRFEDAEQAKATCQANLSSVASHPELHIAWGGNFIEKMQRVARSILQPELEGEIKQAVLHPEAIDILAESEVLCMHGIYQSYHEVKGQEFRLRKQSSIGARHFFLTVKEGEGVLRKEIQRRISADEYDALRRSPQLGRELYKTRYMFMDTGDQAGRRRLWSADTYEQPYVVEWHFETDVETEAEAEELSLLYHGTRRRITTSAKDLIYIE